MTRRAARVVVVMACVATAMTLAPGALARAAEPVDRVVIVPLHGLSFRQAMAEPALRSLAAQGGGDAVPAGAALLVPQEPVAAQLEEVKATWPGRTVVLSPIRSPQQLAEVVEGFDQEFWPDGWNEAVLVVGVRPSVAMIAQKDAVLPLVIGRVGLAGAGGTPAALTSDSTRRSGVVSSVDLVPTVRSLLTMSDDVAGTAGAPVQGTQDPAPEELYERYLQMRRLTVPVQTAAGIYVGVAWAALVLLLALRARGRVSDRLADRARWLALTVGPLAVALFACGHLPSLTYTVVVPFVIVVTVAGTVALVPFARRGAMAPIAALGTGLLLLAVAETIFDWTAALTPLLGGSQLDGGRFFGMPNVVLGLVVGGAVFVATRRSIVAGTLLIAVTVPLIGLPGTGADVGGAITAASAAGLWFGVRRRGRLDVYAIAAGAASAALGAVAILAAHRFLPGSETHATRFAEGSVGGPIDVVIDRLRVGWELIERVPFAVLPVFGIVLLLGLGLRPTRSIRPSFVREPRLRDLVLTMSGAGLVAYLVNDSGPAAVGLFFGLAVGALLYVSLPLATEDDGGRR